MRPARSIASASGASLIASGRVPSSLNMIVDNVCAADARTVYFAGRTTDLTTLVQALAGHPCQTDHLTVRTVADTAVDPGIAGIAAKAGITVEYTASAQPAQWATDPVDESQLRAAATFAEFAGQFRQTFGPTSQLADGQAMIAHDALLTATSAVRLAAQDTGTVSPHTVLDAFHNLHGTQAVDGVTGVIDLDPRTGRAVGKPFALVRIEPDGDEPTLLRVVFPLS